jgi:hypothetical protein
MMAPVSIHAQFIGIGDPERKKNYGARQKYRDSPHDKDGRFQHISHICLEANANSVNHYLSIS